MTPIRPRPAICFHDDRRQGARLLAAALAAFLWAGCGGVGQTQPSALPGSPWPPVPAGDREPLLEPERILTTCQPHFPADRLPCRIDTRREGEVTELERCRFQDGRLVRREELDVREGRRRVIETAWQLDERGRVSARESREVVESLSVAAGPAITEETCRYEYLDQEAREPSQISCSEGPCRRFEYDDDGRVTVERIGPHACPSQREFRRLERDDSGRRVAQTSCEGEGDTLFCPMRIEYVYNDAGQILARRRMAPDPPGWRLYSETSFHYAPPGRLARVELRDHRGLRRVWSLTYGAEGELVELQLRDGEGRLLKTWEYAYACSQADGPDSGGGQP